MSRLGSITLQATCVFSQLLNYFIILSSWGSIKLQAICAIPLYYEVASHVKNCHFGRYYYLYYYIHRKRNTIVRLFGCSLESLLNTAVVVRLRRSIAATRVVAGDVSCLSSEPADDSDDLEDDGATTEAPRGGSSQNHFCMTSHTDKDEMSECILAGIGDMGDARFAGRKYRIWSLLS